MADKNDRSWTLDKLEDTMQKGLKKYFAEEYLRRKSMDSRFLQLVDYIIELSNANSLPLITQDSTEELAHKLALKVGSQLILNKLLEKAVELKGL